MSPYVTFALPPLVALAGGAVAVWVGFRKPKPAPPAAPDAPPAVPTALDRLTARCGGLFRVLGPLLLMGALVWLATVPAPDGWVRRATADGMCSAEFPGAPERELSADGDGADRLQVALPDRNAHFSLTFSDVSAETAELPTDRQFELLRDFFGSKKTPGGAAPKLLDERAFVDTGLPGREYRFVVGEQLVTRIKVIVHRDRVYRAIAVYPPDGKLDRAARRFIDSVRVETPPR